MITLKVQIEMTDEAWMDHVLGSGALSWPWWADGYQNPYGDVVLKHWYNMDTETLDEEYDSEPFVYYTSMQKIADAASEYADQSKFVRDQMANDDFDADGMDRVLQYLVFGEVLFA